MKLNFHTAIILILVVVSTSQSIWVSRDINLGSQFGIMRPSCAALLTTSKCVVTVPDDGNHTDVRTYGFVFEAGLIQDKCSLTIQDSSGSFTSSQTIFQPACQRKIAGSICCECNGCERENFPVHGNTCAILFENRRCSMCQGCRHEVRDGDIITTMHPRLDNKVSSIYLAPDCQFKAFKEPYFQGEYAIATGSIQDVPDGWNDNISSYQCTCGGDNISTNKPARTTTEEPEGTTSTELFPVYSD